MKRHQKSRNIEIGTSKPTENTSMDIAFRQRVHDWNRRFRKPHVDRELALQRLIERVVKGEEDLEFLRAVINTKEWYKEVEACSKKMRWLKGLVR